MQMQKAVAVRSAVSRTALLVSADSSFRQLLAEMLTEMRWKIREASGGAEALCYLEESSSEALLLDAWLPDLDADDLAEQLRIQYPSMDLICVNEVDKPADQAHSSRRNELLYALRRVQTAHIPSHRNVSSPVACNLAPRGIRSPQAHGIDPSGSFLAPKEPQVEADMRRLSSLESSGSSNPEIERAAAGESPSTNTPHEQTSSPMAVELPELLGRSAEMQKLAQSIRLVAPHKTTVLIEGPTGTGKELVARAVHRLSSRASRPLIVLNCAAIPEALLEAELFGHTRGAFTGAVQARTGRIEAAHGGSLFLDEIGEMPLALQSKLLRFLESGEIQRLGENEVTRVDVRVIAATHQPLAQRVAEEKFRSDLYFRLAVFSLRTPSLADRREDIPALAEHFLRRLGEIGPSKTFDPGVLVKLSAHGWPGNVRELAHVVERAYILAENCPRITANEISFT